MTNQLCLQGFPENSQWNVSTTDNLEDEDEYDEFDGDEYFEDSEGTSGYSKLSDIMYGLFYETMQFTGKAGSLKSQRVGSSLTLDSDSSSNCKRMSLPSL